MMRWMRRLQYMLRRRRLEEELSEELALHQQLKQRELQQRGWDAARAAHESRRVLGSATLTRQHVRDVWIPPWLQDLEQDVRLALRRLAVDRRFFVTAVVVLALGIGANLTVFTIVNALVLRPLPFPRPEELVVAGLRDVSGRDLLPSYPDFQEWRARTRAFAGLVGEVVTAMNLSGEDQPAERVSGSYISFDMFRLVGRTPVIGRDFVAEDDRPGASPVAILGYGVWMNRYGGDPTIVGRVVRVNDVPSTIVGVMPAGFGFPFASEIWQPLTLFSGVARATRQDQPRSVTPTVFGRLAPGVSLTQARTDLTSIVAQLSREYPEAAVGTTPTLRPLTDLYVEGFRPIARTLVASVAFILLIACANLANLFLARGLSRLRDFRIQAALGATRWRIVRQQLAEGTLIATAGGAIGLLLSTYGVTLATAVIAAGSPPPWGDWSRDWRVYAFLVVVTVGATVLFSVLPTVHTARWHTHETLREGMRGSATGGRTNRWASALVVCEIALTLVLLAGTALMLRSFLAVSRAGLVVRAEGLTTMRLAVANQKYPTPEHRKRFFTQLDERLTHVPGLSSATLASDIPLLAASVDGLITRQVELEGQRQSSAEPLPTVAHVYVGPRYFETLGVSLVRGRGFEPTDGRAGQVGAIVNQRFASLFFGDRDPTGTRVRLSIPNSKEPPAEWMTIVGVSPTVPETLAAAEPRPVVYLPVQAEPQPHRFVSIIARAAPGVAIVPVLRDAIRAVDPDLPAYNVRTMDDTIAMNLVAHRFTGGIIAVLAAIGLVLASVGLYAVTAQSVSQRTPEIGVRVALGAQARHVIVLFARRVGAQLGVGLALGLAGGLVADAVLRSMFVGTEPRDPLTFVSVAAVLVVISLIACVLPIWKALHVPPMASLRAE